MSPRDTIDDLTNQEFTLRCKSCGKRLVIVPSHTGYGEYRRVGSSECYCEVAVVNLEVVHAKRLGRFRSGDGA